MTKEYLEALNIIKFNPDNVDGLQYLKAFKVVESALQRLESIDNAKPSEALKCLKVLEDCASVCGDYSHRVEPIKQVLLKAQEQEKEIDRLENQCLDVLADNIRLKNKSQEQEQVLKILKEKHLFEPTHKYIVDYSKDYATYCKLFKSYKLDEANKLTEEEFYLVKRYFK